jgi:hypothetical protein
MPVINTGLLARRRLRDLGWWMAGALVVALAASLWQYHRAARASVPDVAAQAAISTQIAPSRALRMTVDGLGFPQAIQGYRVLGGSTFEVGGRGVAAVVFARGEQRLTYAIVAGAGHVNYYDDDGEYAPTPRYTGKRELNWYGDTIVVVKRNSRTIVITGTPASKGLQRAMQTLALQFPA